MTMGRAEQELFSFFAFWGPNLLDRSAKTRKIFMGNARLLLRVRPISDPSKTVIVSFARIAVSAVPRCTIRGSAAI